MQFISTILYSYCCLLTSTLFNLFSVQDPQSLWRNILSQIEGRCPLSPNNTEDYFSLIIFALANVIQRPIIVIDCSSSSGYATAFPLSLTSDLQGIYLPLEKSPATCNKVPVFICHESNRFSPLMFPLTGDKTANFPLINGDLTSVTIRYLIDGANPEMILQQYLNIQEVHCQSNNKSVRNMFYICSMVKALPEYLNPVMHHFKRCKEIFDNYISSQKSTTYLLQENKKLSPMSTQQLMSTNCFQHINDKSQTKIVSAPATISSSRSSSISSLHPLTPSTNKTTAITREGLATKVKTFKSSMQTSSLISPQLSPQRSQSQLPTETAYVPRYPMPSHTMTGCMLLRPDNLSSKSLVQSHAFHIQDASIHKKNREQHRNVVGHPNQDLMSITNVGEPDLPSASNDQRFQEETNNIGFLDSISAPMLSLVNESCHQCLFYFCSENTYPYCHECSNQRAAKQSSNKTSSPFDSQRNANSSSSFHNFDLSKDQKEKILQQQVKAKVKNQIDEIQNEKTVSNRENKRTRYRHKGKEAFFPSSHQRQLFCHSHECYNLKEIHSRFCPQCLMQGKDNGTLPEDMILTPASNIPSNSNEIDQSQNYAQAQSEHLFPYNENDDALIEISVAPLQKCISKVCQNRVSTNQSLCDRCQSILTKQAAQMGTPEESNCSVRQDNENEHSEKSLRTNQLHSHTITRPPMLTQECIKKSHSEKLNRASNLNPNSKEMLRAAYKNSYSNDRNGKSAWLNNMKTGKADVEMKTLASPLLNLHVSKNGVDIIIHHPNLLSESRNIDSKLHNKYMQLNNEQRKGVPKCQTVSCENFSNKQNYGFCNACFSALSIEDKQVAIFGKTEIG